MRLTGDLAAGRNVVLPTVTSSRYVTRTQGTTTLTVTSPADGSSVAGSPVTVTGTTAPGNQVYVSATNIDVNSATTTASTTAAANGSFSVDVAVTGGTSVLNIVAVSATGGTAHAKRTVLFDFVPGTVLLDVTDPNGDDNGPGNYAYPTSGDFKPGAYDIQQFQVYDAGSEVIFRLKTRDLTPTFGSPLGAQLVDVYVRVPGAATTSTAAANPTRNFAIAAPFAWSRLIQVQGFGQRYVDAGGATLGTVSISANAISRFITVRVPKASLGTPGPGWGFTVVLTGQDGFSSDQARGFQPTPQPFQFGVCAAPSADPHCTFNPGLVPKAVDVITPPGVLQSDELDYTIHSPVDDQRRHDSVAAAEAGSRGARFRQSRPGELEAREPRPAQIAERQAEGDPEHDDAEAERQRVGPLEPPVVAVGRLDLRRDVRMGEAVGDVVRPHRDVLPCAVVTRHPEREVRIQPRLLRLSGRRGHVGVGLGEDPVREVRDHLDLLSGACALVDLRCRKGSAADEHHRRDCERERQPGEPPVPSAVRHAAALLLTPA